MIIVKSDAVLECYQLNCEKLFLADFPLICRKFILPE